MTRFLLILACIAAMASAPSVAEAGTAEVKAYVEGVANQALSTISNAKLSKSQKQAKLNDLFADSVDIPWVGRFVMGRFWRQANESQKSSYLREYQKFLIKHYTARFIDYTSGSFTVTGVRDDGDNEFTVSMTLQGDKASEPVLVDYRVRAGGGYKIFDLIVEGVSLITTQREEFTAVVNQKGIDHLIAQLQSRSQDEVAAK